MLTAPSRTGATETPQQERRRWVLQLVGYLRMTEGAWPSVRRIAHETGASLSTTSLDLKALESAKLIERDGEDSRASYRLVPRDTCASCGAPVFEPPIASAD